MADQRALTLVQEDNHLAFNQLVAAQSTRVDLSNGQFRGYDLRKFNLKGANMTDCYLRNSDLRGLDLSETEMGGASIKDCKVSGVYFPVNISVEEIRLSLELGTRLRPTKSR